MKGFPRSLVFVLGLATLLSACSTRNYIGHAAQDYQEFSCFIEEEVCGLTWQNDSHIVYRVIDQGNNTYRVIGEVDYNIKYSAKRDFVSFYCLFMNNDEVIHEHRIKTFGRDKDIDFTVELEQPITTTTIHGLKLWVRT